MKSEKTMTGYPPTDKVVKNRLQKILQKYDGEITGLKDLTGDDPPSILFYILGNCMSYLLNPDAEAVITEKSVRWRKKAHFIIQTLGSHFLTNPQVFENRNYLKDITQLNVPDDTGITLPNEPVIWASNHGFKDDVLASVLAARRHAYILFGSLPQFFNTFDGITAWLNGVAMANRKLRSSSHASTEKAIRAMQYGADLLIFPEGVWNKSPNALIINLWPGIYRIACETGAKVVPIVHFIRDYNNKLKDNPIHTVIDDPVRIDDLPEQAALELIRDVLATWHYLMMEAYGQSTHDELLSDADTATRAWEQHLIERVATADRYDTEIELCADYRPKGILRPEEVWKAVADIEHLTLENANDVLYAKELVQSAAKNDFQRRF